MIGVTFVSQVINPFVPNAPFLSPWKHQKTVTRKVFWCFIEVEKGCLGRFSDVFRGQRKGALEKWEWMFKVYWHCGISKIVSVFLVQIGLNTALLFYSFCYELSFFVKIRLFKSYFHEKAEVKTKWVKLFLYRARVSVIRPLL